MYLGLSWKNKKERRQLQGRSQVYHQPSPENWRPELEEAGRNGRSLNFSTFLGRGASMGIHDAGLFIASWASGNQREPYSVP